MSVSRSLAWMGAAQVLGIVLQFAVQIILARVLSLHDAGIYAIALAMVGALSLIQNLGLQALIVREEKLTPDLSATTFTVQIVISFGVALIILLLSYAGAATLGEPGVGRVLAALAPLPLIAAMSFLPMAMLERQGRFKHIAFITTVGSIAGAVVTIIGALYGFNYMSAAFGQWASAIIIVFAMIATARNHFQVRLSFAGWRRVASFGMQLLTINGVNALGLRLSDIMLPRFLGLSALGLYSRASGLNGLLWANVHVMIGRVMLVDFARLVREGVPLRKRYLETVDIVTLLLWPIFAGFAVVAGPFILVVFGERWLPATKTVMLLAGSSMILVAITMTWEIFTATDRLHVQARIEFIRAIVALALFAAGCLISIEAAAASRILEAFFAVALYRRHLNKMTDTQTSDYWPIYGRNLALTVLAIGPAVSAMAINGWRADISLVLLFASVTLGALLWLGAVILTRHRAWLLMRDTAWSRRIVAKYNGMLGK